MSFLSANDVARLIREVQMATERAAQYEEEAAVMLCRGCSDSAVENMLKHAHLEIERADEKRRLLDSEWEKEEKVIQRQTTKPCVWIGPILLVAILFLGWFFVY